MIAAISPADYNYEETLSTLRYVFSEPGCILCACPAPETLPGTNKTMQVRESSQKYQEQTEDQ